VAVRSAAPAERPRADPAQPTRVGPAGEHGTRGGERPRAGAVRSAYGRSSRLATAARC